MNGQLPNVEQYYGHPYFFGRYIGGAYAVTSGEVNYAHQNSVKVLLIYNGVNGNNATGPSNGQAAAQNAINAAAGLGAPNCKVLMADIEANWSIDANFIRAYYDTIAADGRYRAGFYFNPYSGSSPFSAAYCQAVSAEAAVGQNTSLWSDEPQPGRTTSAAKPSYNPAGPSCYSGKVPGWQYGTPSSGGTSGANIDTDEFDSSMDAFLW